MFELISLDNINSIGQMEVGKIGDELIVKTKNSKYVFKQKEN